MNPEDTPRLLGGASFVMDTRPAPCIAQQLGKHSRNPALIAVRFSIVMLSSPVLKYNNVFIVGA